MYPNRLASKPLSGSGSAFVTFVFLITYMSVPLLTDQNPCVRFNQMPINSYNCVRLTVDALKARYGRNMKARGNAPSDATIARYVRSCRNAELLPDLLHEVEKLSHWFSPRVPLKVLISRPYSKPTSRRSARTIIRTFRLPGPDVAFPEAADCHQCPDTLAIRFYPDTSSLNL